MRGSARLATSIGIGMTFLGFALIGLAWNGAATLGSVQAQLAYALSGGLAGLGLIISGMAVLTIQTQRGLTATRAMEISRLQAELDGLLRAVIRRAPGELVDDETTVDVRAGTVTRPIRRNPLSAAPSSPRDGGRYGPKSRGRRPDGPASPMGSDAPATQPLPVAMDSPPGEADERWRPADPSQEAQRLRTVLAGVSGVGPAKQALLVDRFGTLDAVRRADLVDLAALPGISTALAERVQAACAAARS